MNMIPDNKKVLVVQDATASYPLTSPFPPDENYPEYPFEQTSSRPNHAYRMVRELLYGYGLDRERFDTASWNPLGELISPGDVVLIKPNLVQHINMSGADAFSVFTHGSIVRAVLDYVYIALGDSGMIIVGDSPVQSCNFNRLKKLNGLDALQEFYKREAREITLADFRVNRAIADNTGMIVDNVKNDGDPNGYMVVDIQQNSMLVPISKEYKRYRVTNYDPKEMLAHHNQEKNEYVISGSVLKADVIINLPKMKTHRKVGLSSAMKNMVGINGHKDWIAHHRTGSVQEGGDEYPNKSLVKKITVWLTERGDVSDGLSLKKFYNISSRFAYRLAKTRADDGYFEGSWYGNDTLWRSVHDLNRILLYGDKKGRLKEVPQRRIFTIVDGITAGEGEGPLAPSDKQCGLLIGGPNLVAVDVVIARLMGFDYRKIPLIEKAFGAGPLPLIDFLPEEIEVRSNQAKWDRLNVGEKGESYNFTPPAGWKGHIELGLA